MKTNICVMLIVMTLLLASCNNNPSNNSDVGENTTNESALIDEVKSNADFINDTISVPIELDDNGNPTALISITVKSVSLEKGKIENVLKEPLKNVPTGYVKEDGTLLDGYSFIAIQLDYLSEIDIPEISVTSFSLRGVSETEIAVSECFYQDSPIEGADSKSSGFSNLIANTNKTITIGYFVDDKMINCDEHFLDLGEEYYINLTNSF